MPSALVSSTLYSEPVYEAGTFEVETDSVLQYVSTMTGELNTEVTAAICPECGYVMLEVKQ